MIHNIEKILRMIAIKFNIQKDDDTTHAFDAFHRRFSEQGKDVSMEPKQSPKLCEHSRTSHDGNQHIASLASAQVERARWMSGSIEAFQVHFFRSSVVGCVVVRYVVFFET